MGKSHGKPSKFSMISYGGETGQEIFPCFTQSIEIQLYLMVNYFYLMIKTHGFPVNIFPRKHTPLKHGAGNPSFRHDFRSTALVCPAEIQNPQKRPLEMVINIPWINPAKQNKP